MSEKCDGQHRNPTEQPGYFTTTYFHRPEELRAEVAEAGLSVEGLFGLEGPARTLADFDVCWANARQRADTVRLAELLESDPALLGMSPQLVAVVRKPA